LNQLKRVLEDGLELARDSKTNQQIVHTLNNSTTEDKARISFLRAFDLIKLVKIEVAKYQQIQEVIKNLENALHEGDQNREKYKSFVQVLYTNTLSINLETLVYTFDLTGDGTNVIDVLDVMNAGDYPEYSLYIKTLELPKHQQDTMYQRAQETITTLKSERSTFIAQLQATQAKLERNQKRVFANQHTVTDAATILAFYEICVASVSGLLDQIAEIDI
jgi:hypothetical protein